MAMIPFWIIFSLAGLCVLVSVAVTTANVWKLLKAPENQLRTDEIFAGDLEIPADMIRGRSATITQDRVLFVGNRGSIASSTTVWRKDGRGWSVSTTGLAGPYTPVIIYQMK